MFSYNVRYPTFLPHNPVSSDWHYDCTRYAVSYGALEIYAEHEGEEYLRATYPAGQWVNIFTFGPQELGRNDGMALVGPVVNGAQHQAIGVANGI